MSGEHFRRKRAKKLGLLKFMHLFLKIGFAIFGYRAIILLVGKI